MKNEAAVKPGGTESRQKLTLGAKERELGSNLHLLDGEWEDQQAEGDSGRRNGDPPAPNHHSISASCYPSFPGLQENCLRSTSTRTQERMLRSKNFVWDMSEIGCNLQGDLTKEVLAGCERRPGWQPRCLLLLRTTARAGRFLPLLLDASRLPVPGSGRARHQRLRGSSL